MILQAACRFNDVMRISRNLYTYLLGRKSILYTCDLFSLITACLKFGVLPSHRRVDKYQHVLLRHCWKSTLGKDNRAKHREAGFGGLVIPDI